MRTTTLRVLSEGGRDELARIEDRDGHLVVVHVDLVPAVRRWLEHGITEWVGTGLDAEQRTTLPGDPEFVARLAAYVQKESGLSVYLDRVVDTTPKPARTTAAVGIVRVRVLAAGAGRRLSCCRGKSRERRRCYARPGGSDPMHFCGNPIHDLPGYILAAAPALGVLVAWLRARFA